MEDLMSAERIAERKAKLAKLRVLALEEWESSFHEGDAHDFEYFVKGFMAGHRAASLTQADKIWLKNDEVKNLLQCSAGTLQNYRKAGILSYFKVGGTLFYTKESILNFIEANKVK